MFCEMIICLVQVLTLIPKCHQKNTTKHGDVLARVPLEGVLDLSEYIPE